MIRSTVLRLIERRVMTRREPDFTVGPTDAPTMERWRILKAKRLGIYVHRFLQDDADDDLHDHPWSSLSWLLSGQYVEETESGKTLHRTGTLKFRSAKYRHRILLTSNDNSVVTLFIVGRKVRRWGFWRDGLFKRSGK